MSKKKLTSDDFALWVRTTKTVTPLTSPQYIHRPAPHSNPAPARISASEFFKASAKPLNELQKLDYKQVRQLNRGRQKTEAKLDLHGLRREAAYSALTNFIHQCYDKNMKWVQVVTGKGVGGVGVLRREVPQWLRSPHFSAMVFGVEEAARHRGGAGSLDICLRKKTPRHKKQS